MLLKASWKLEAGIWVAVGPEYNNAFQKAIQFFLFSYIFGMTSDHFFRFIYTLTALIGCKT